MLRMQKFHVVLVADPASQDPYLRKLKALTCITPSRLKSCTQALGWQTWSPEQLQALRPS